MSRITSSLGDDIEITCDRDAYPERVTVAADGYRYTVFAADKMFMHGEMTVLDKLARPNAETHLATFRLAPVHDKILAKNHGFDGSWACFLRAIAKSESSSLEIGAYYELQSAGWVMPIDAQEPTDPEFYVVWYDANRLGEKRLGVGDVLVKGLVETTGADFYGNAEVVTFCGNELSTSGALSLLLEKDMQVTASVVTDAFCKLKLEKANFPECGPRQHLESALHFERVYPDFNEGLDAFRLLYDAAGREECYLELLNSARNFAIRKTAPDFIVEELKSNITASVHNKSFVLAGV